MKFINSPLIVLCIATCLVLQSCIDKSKYLPKPYEKPLEVVKLSDNNYLHVSYIKTDSGDFIPCNGYIYINDNEAIVFDTPLNDSISNQLIDFVQDDLKAQVKGVIVHHAHYDAAGGVHAFTKRNIPSYALEKTATILAQDSIVISNPFKSEHILELNGEKIISKFYGEAHTSESIISYIPSEKALFGGCMIKALDAGEGNIADANLDEWSTTVQHIVDANPDVQLVIPGHGQIGGKSLLEYTIQLFAPEDEIAQEQHNN